MSTLFDFLPPLLTGLGAALPPLAVLLPLWHILFWKDLRKTVRYGILCLYLSAVWALTGMPDVFSARYAPKVNLIPFAGMIAAPVPTILNVLLFLPLGVMLPLFWMRYRDGKNAVLAGLSLSLGVELSQLFSGITDIDDLIANTAGTFLGYLIACALLLRWPRLADTDGLPWERGVLLATVFCVMFFLAPLVRTLL